MRTQPCLVSFLTSYSRVGAGTRRWRLFAGGSCLAVTSASRAVSSELSVCSLFSGVGLGPTAMDAASLSGLSGQSRLVEKPRSGSCFVTLVLGVVGGFRFRLHPVTDLNPSSVDGHSTFLSSRAYMTRRSLSVRPAPLIRISTSVRANLDLSS